MKIDCNVIRDLLPLYYEDIASKESRELVEEHCKECTECKNIQMNMSDEEFAIIDNGNGLKKFIKDCKRNFNALLAITCYTLLVIGAIIHGKCIGPDAAGAIVLYGILLFPLVGLFCNIAVASQKLKIKYIFPIVCGFIGDLYQYILLDMIQDYEINVFFFGANFIPALIGFIIGMIISKVGINNGRKINEGMVAGIFIVLLSIALALYTPPSIPLDIVMGIGGIAIFVVSFICRIKCKKK